MEEKIAQRHLKKRVVLDTGLTAILLIDHARWAEPRGSAHLRSCMLQYSNEKALRGEIPVFTSGFN